MEAKPTPSQPDREPSPTSVGIFRVTRGASRSGSAPPAVSGHGRPLPISSDPEVPEDAARRRRIEVLKRAHDEGKLATEDRLRRAAEGILRASSED